MFLPMYKTYDTNAWHEQYLNGSFREWEHFVFCKKVDHWRYLFFLSRISARLDPIIFHILRKFYI